MDDPYDRRIQEMIRVGNVFEGRILSFDTLAITHSYDERVRKLFLHFFKIRSSCCG